MTPANAANADAKHPGKPDGRPSLLIADDDAVVRAVLSSQLAGHFHVVAVAEDAAEAIERLDHKAT